MSQFPKHLLHKVLKKRKKQGSLCTAEKTDTFQNQIRFLLILSTNCYFVFAVFVEKKGFDILDNVFAGGNLLSLISYSNIYPNKHPLSFNIHLTLKLHISLYPQKGRGW